MNLVKKEQKFDRHAPNVLDDILQQFYVEVHKKDGSDYEPSSPANEQTALNCF